MNTVNLPVHRRPAVAAGWELYHVLHPTDMMADLWTPDRVLAWSWYEQFVRRYGSAHLHMESLPAGQYAASCLMRTVESVSTPRLVR